jgi:twitching motility protein PilT
MAVEVLFGTGKPQEVILAILNHIRGLVGWLRNRVLETLKTFGDRAFEPAVALLAHPEEEVRTTALVVAEHFNDPRVIEPVAKLLKDSDWWLRISACDTLGRLKDAAAVPHLVAALEDPDARWAAIDALALIGNPASLRPLVNLLRDPRVEVRLDVLRAIGRFDDPRLAQLLQQVKEKDPSSEVRTRATEVARDLAGRLGQGTAGPEKGTMAVSAASVQKPLDRLLALAREKGASDVHVSVGEPPLARFNGVLGRMEGMQPLDEVKTKEAVYSILEPRQRKELEEIGEIDFCHAIAEVGRYRANAFVQRKGLCANFRVIPNVPPTFQDLRIPPQLAELLDYHQGLIVVSGPAGSGKSTTLAAVVNLINEAKADHVITLEDPIEFAHPVKNALINQREVGRHTVSFARALRAALREDPDVIIVGEMRDAETVRLALTAAETGHLVVGTLHTTGAVATIERLIKSFPPDEQSQVRMALSESLKYIVSQQLIPRADGRGRVAVFEVLKGTISVGNLIRDSKTHQIPSQMQIGKRFGMQTRDAALMELVEAGIIAAETAWARADKPDTFEPLCDASKIHPRTEAS